MYQNDGYNTERRGKCSTVSVAGHVKSIFHSYDTSGRNVRAFATDGERARERRDDRQLRVSHILFQHNDDQGFRDAESKLRQAASDGGGSKLEELFGQMAKEYSSCPSSRALGDLGWVTIGQMVQEFEDAIFRHDVGEILTCSTDFGRHIVLIRDEQRRALILPLSAEELAQMMAEGSQDEYQLIDVREDSEIEKTGLLPGFQVFSLSKFDEWGSNVSSILDPAKTTIVLCHHGIRSLQVCQYLANQKFMDLRNVTGGINAYSNIVPSIPKY
eukprot:jgi/Picsp_1/1772/NSC_05244-R1_peptidyl-prolyl cis-trans parvulin-type